MTRLTGSLDALSNRGAPQGPAAVLDGARGVARARRRRRRAEAAVLGAAGVAAVVALGFGAIGGGDTVETEGDPATAPTPTPPPSAPTGTTPPPPPGATPDTSVTTTTPTSPTAAPTRPGSATTGPTGDPASLRRMTTSEVEALMQPGAVIENVEITGGNLDVVADGVTLRNFRLDADGAPYGIRSIQGRTGFVAEDGEILDTSSAGFYGGDATFRRLDVHDSDNAAFKLLTGVTVEDSWWHHLGRGGSGIGVQLEDGNGGTHTIRRNHCELPADVPAPYNSDSCLLVNADAPWTVVVEGNWLDGGNRSTVDCGGAAGVDVRGNRIGRRWVGEVPIMRCPTASGNVWADTGAPVG